MTKKIDKPQPKQRPKPQVTPLRDTCPKIILPKFPLSQNIPPQDAPLKIILPEDTPPQNTPFKIILPEDTPPQNTPFKIILPEDTPPQDTLQDVIPLMDEMHSEVSNTLPPPPPDPTLSSPPKKRSDYD